MMFQFVRAAWNRKKSSPWNSIAPVRDELFGEERLMQHARSLAGAQFILERPSSGPSLTARLKDNAHHLLRAYETTVTAAGNGEAITPAAEWLLDNYHLVEKQVRQIRDDLPASYYRQLPKLGAGSFAGYPRVFGLAWAFIAHTDSHFDSDLLCRFVQAYQTVQPLTIGELWAVAITLRIVLIENLRRLADEITDGRIARLDADAMADRLLEHKLDALAAPTPDFLVSSNIGCSLHIAAGLRRRGRTLTVLHPLALLARQWPSDT